jgi:GT2 family glycosyltransferase
MDATIVIPNLNSIIINKTLFSLCNQDYKGQFEVIVVGMDKYDIVFENDLISFYKTEIPFSPAKARNRGALIAQGDIIIFLDADCIAPRDWLSRILSYFDDEDIVGVGGGVKFLEKNYWSIADNLSMFYPFLFSNQEKESIQLPSLNFAVKKSAFNKINGFDERYPKPSGEDFDFTMRLSKTGKIVFSPSSWIWHIPPRSSFRDLIRHSRLQGTYSTKVDWRYKKQIQFPFRNKYLLLFFSPFLALIVTIKIFYSKNRIKYFYTFPVVFLSKLAWCWGASKSPWLIRNSKR